MPDVPLVLIIVHMFFSCQAWLVLIFWWGEGRGREGGLRGNERSLDSARDDDGGRATVGVGRRHRYELHPATVIRADGSACQSIISARPR
jgi:hypothetical protein